MPKGRAVKVNGSRTASRNRQWAPNPPLERPSYLLTGLKVVDVTDAAPSGGDREQMQGKNAVVTGATNGIGYRTAEGLAARGMTVFCVGRDPEKANETVSRIRAETGNDNVHCLISDLSVQSGVRSLVAGIKEAVPHVDILINNAGGMFTTRQLTGDGIEMTWALNHLAYFLTTVLLLDHLRAAPAARVVNVSSQLHARARIRFDDPGLEQGYGGIFAYNQSKLANVMFTYELARRLKDSNVTANCLHPGGVNTGIGDNNGFLFRNVYKLIKRFALTDEQGARTSIYLATSEEVEGITGRYFEKCADVPSSAASRVEADQQRLWDLSAAQVGIPA